MISAIDDLVWSRQRSAFMIDRNDTRIGVAITERDREDGEARDG